MSFRVIQWSTGNVGRHALRGDHPSPRSRARGPVGPRSAEGRPRRRRARAASRRSASRRPTTPTALLALERRLRLVHRDGRPPSCRCGRGHVPHPRRRHERGRDLGRAAGLSARRRSGHRREARGRVPRRRHVVLHLRHRSRASPTTRCRSRLTGLCARVDSVRVMEIVNYDTYDQPEVLFGHHGIREAARPHAAAPDPRRPDARVGARRAADRRGTRRRPSTRCARPHERRATDASFTIPSGHGRRRHDGRRCASRSRRSSAAGRRSSSST